MTGRREVEAAFARLRNLVSQHPVAANTYMVERFDDDATRFLAHSADGVDSLIIATVMSAPVAPLRLTGLSVDYGVDCVLIEDGRRSEIRASVVRSSPERLASSDLFATLCASLLEGLPTPTTDQTLSHEVERWSRLFWRLTQTATVTLVGLAGELTSIAESSDVQRWVGAWHARPEDRFDFSFLPGLGTVEVKSTTRDRRLHDVSLTQVSGPDLDSRFFASLRIVEGERSLGELVRDISDRLVDDHARLAFWNVLTLTCGAGLDDAMTFRFDYEVARTSIRYHRATAVPRPTVEAPLPTGVSNVRFTSDFDAVDSVALGIVEAALG